MAFVLSWPSSPKPLPSNQLAMELVAVVDSRRRIGL
jgi:hypothetical protein